MNTGVVKVEKSPDGTFYLSMFLPGFKSKEDAETYALAILEILKQVLDNVDISKGQ